MSRKPAFWIVLVLLAAVSVVFAIRNFSSAFPIVSIDLQMDRAAALKAAAAIKSERHLGPAGAFRQAASFGVDDTVKTFVELEGGGAAVFRDMLSRGLYHAYTWKVRHFREGEPHELSIRFTPAGRPYGFVEKLSEKEPGPSLAEPDARRIAERAAGDAWQVDLAAYAPAEYSKEVRPGGRTDHTFVYERRDEHIKAGKYRVRMVVSGDRLTELTHFVLVPEAFARHFEEMRSANNAIAFGAQASAIVLYLFVGGGFGLFVLLRKRYVLWRQPLFWAGVVALFQALAVLNAWPLDWMEYDTAVPGGTFLLQRISLVVGTFFLTLFYLTISFMAAESLTRRAFPHHPQLWRIGSRESASSIQVLGRTVGGYLYTGIELAYIVGFYLIASRLFGWWTPSESLIEPDILATYFPWLSAVAPSMHAGIWEECLFRAVPIAGAALIGDRLGNRKLWIGIALVLQAVIFGGGHANYPSEPSYSRLVELILPALIWGLVYLNFGLLPTIITHYVFDLSLFSITLFTASSPGAKFEQTMIVVCGLVPLGVLLVARLRSKRWSELPSQEYNRAWVPEPVVAAAAEMPRPVLAGIRVSPARVRAFVGLGILALVFWGVTSRMKADAPPLRIVRSEALRRGNEALVAHGFKPEPRWKTLSTIVDDPDVQHLFVWRTSGPDAYRALLGTYLSPPHWNVRKATFVGNIAERADEWQAVLAPDGDVTRVKHQLPQGRPGATLEEDAARALALDALRHRLGVDPTPRDSSGHGSGLEAVALKEISAVSTKLPARRDWTFTFADTGSHALEKGEPRIRVDIAGDQVIDAYRFVKVPEDWERQHTSDESLLSVLSASRILIVAVIMIAGVIFAIIAWSRGDFPARFAVGVFALVFVIGLIQVANSWPLVEARLKNDQPLQLQESVAMIAGALGQLITSAMAALLAGFALRRARTLSPSRGTPILAGIAVGALVVGFNRVVGLLARSSTPGWPNYTPAATSLPLVADLFSPVNSVLLRCAVVLVILTTVHRLTEGWTRGRMLYGPLLFIVGAIIGQTGAAPTTTLWLVQAALSGTIFVVLYALLLRFDLTLIPAVIGTIAVLSAVRAGLLGAYPGARVGSLLGAIVAATIAWAGIRALRREDRTEPSPPSTD